MTVVFCGTSDVVGSVSIVKISLVMGVVVLGVVVLGVVGIGVVILVGSFTVTITVFIAVLPSESRTMIV
ncbi:MAG: hypothetical protein ACFFDT_13670 [Candidatus Hodarchaeota archaeon]